MSHIKFEMTLVESIAVLSSMQLSRDITSSRASGTEDLERLIVRLEALQMEYAEKNPSSAQRQLKAIR